MEDKFTVKFDYLSATFPLECDSHENELFKVHETVRMVAKFLNLKITEIGKQDYATNRFKYQFMLGNYITLRLAGPINDMQKKTCQIELKGDGCRDFEKRCKGKSWLEFILWLVQLNARFKRVDIAIDDYTGGDVTMSYILDKLKRGFYTSVFTTKPKPIGTIEDGLTIQFGSNNSETELVVYDKLLEQRRRNKISDKDYWVRYEMRFRGDKAERVIYQLCRDCLNEEDELYGLSLEQFACEQLYRILDIKTDNSQTRKNQKNIKTDEKWMKFLHGVNKGKLGSLGASDPISYQNYFDKMEKQMSLYIILKYLQVKGNSDLFDIEMLKIFLKYSDFNKGKMFKMNMYLEEMKLAPLTKHEFDTLKSELEDLISDLELPF